MSTKTTPQILREAADHVEEVGLGVGDFFTPVGPSKTPLGQRPCCAMGAISYISGYWVDDPETHGAVPPSAQFELSISETDAIYDQDARATVAFGDHLRRQGLSNSIPVWSDNSTTTEVAAQLRAAADYEEAHQ